MKATKTGKALHKRQEILLSDPFNTILHIGDEQFYFEKKEIDILRRLNINTIEQFMLLDLYHIDNAHRINSTTLKLLYRSQGILNRLIGNIVIDNDVKIKKIKKYSKTGKALHKRQEILLSNPSNTIRDHVNSCVNLFFKQRPFCVFCFYF